MEDVYHYKTGTEMDIGTETSLAKPESLLGAELLAKAYPTPRPPKCMTAFSDLWNSLARDAAFLLARFVPVNSKVWSKPAKAGALTTFSFVAAPPLRHNSSNAATAFSLPLGVAQRIIPIKPTTAISSFPTASAPIGCLTIKAKAPATSSATPSLPKALTRAVTAFASIILTQLSVCVERLNKAVTASFFPLEVPSLSSPAKASIAPCSSAIRFL
ncbi:hypothetical protein PanWU01x14_247830 [Parasponia andersonii]|uniref:Uncharacterized protein n=1 Tax=Parasponia andersonii TaxID=3476 RepID=A0A2P5BDR3_PARAD|nr:hypothetical protein PanWU01x14_247830 [Parasponia andersonii]